MADRLMDVRCGRATSDGGEITTAVVRHCTIGHMPTVRLFASARDAAGVGRDELPGTTVDEVLVAASDRYGAGFEAVLGSCKIWVNGEPAAGGDAIGADDELAVLPPVSGGCS